MKKIRAILIIIAAALVFAGCAGTENMAEPVIAAGTMREEIAQPTALVNIATEASDILETTAAHTAYITMETTSITESVTETTSDIHGIIEATQQSTAPQVITRPPGEKMLAITFDDGPGRYTQPILDLLEKYGGRATFFVLGGRVWNNRYILKNIMAQGSEVAGHSWHHINFLSLGEQCIRDQIEYTDRAIYNITRVEPPRFFRPPFGAFNETVRDVALDTGTAIIMWSVDPRDWESRDPDRIYNYIMERAHDGGIIVAHDIHRTTAEAMERVIPSLIERGFKLVTVSELLGETVPGRVYYSEFRSAD